MDNFANDLCGLVLHVIAIRKETVSMCKDNDYYFLCPLSNPFFRDIAFKKEAPTEPRFQFTVCYRHGTPMESILSCSKLQRSYVCIANDFIVSGLRRCLLLFP
jgi:hypothetical protein